MSNQFRKIGENQVMQQLEDLRSRNQMLMLSVTVLSTWSDPLPVELERAIQEIMTEAGQTKPSPSFKSVLDDVVAMVKTYKEQQGYVQPSPPPSLIISPAQYNAEASAVNKQNDEPSTSSF